MSKNAQFQQFFNKKSNAAIKEQFKQEKRAAKKERSAAIEKRYEEKRRQQEESQVGGRKSGDGSRGSKGKGQQAGRAESGAMSREPGVGRRELPGRKRKAGVTDQQPATGNRQSKSQNPSIPKSLNPKIPQPLHDRQAGPNLPLMPLNKYLSHSGICSRRDAAELIRQGEVKVNHELVTEPGTKVSPKDMVTVRGKKITMSKNLVYILLNKPRDYITTTDDPEGRKTVLDLVKQATAERVYPVGRLDRNTSGVLLLTNDGELAQTLSHPRHEVKKIYEVGLNKPFTRADFETMLGGITLEDGFIAPDALGYANPKDKSVIGIEIHSGRNRIVRRMFEHLGYDVRQLDRVMYAGLTKKNVQRGKWRLLTEREIRILKHFNPQTKKTAAPAGKPAPEKNPRKLKR